MIGSGRMLVSFPRSSPARGWARKSPASKRSQSILGRVKQPRLSPTEHSTTMSRRHRLRVEANRCSCPSMTWQIRPRRLRNFEAIHWQPR